MTTATRLVGDPRLKCLSVTGALAVAVSVVATGLLAGALLGAATASAQEPARTIIVTDKGTQSIGAFSTKPSGNRPWATLAQAIRAFGAPSSVQHRFGRTGCRVRWASLGLRIEFANYGGRPACSPRYGYAQTAAVGGPGAAGWVTDRGLAIGAPVACPAAQVVMVLNLSDSPLGPGHWSQTVDR